jgi:hypothetical protein
MFTNLGSLFASFGEGILVLIDGMMEGIRWNDDEA